MRLYKRSPMLARDGFMLAPLLYMLALAGIGGAVMFSGYSQILRSNAEMTSINAARSQLQSAGQTLSASSALDGATSSIVQPPAVFAFSSVTGADINRLPTDYDKAELSGAPTQVGIMDVSSGVRQLDPWGKFYIYCRWENAVSAPSAPSLAVLTAGPDGVLTTKCGDTSAQGDDRVITSTVAETINRANVWQVSSSNQVKFGLDSNAVRVNQDGSLLASSLWITEPVAGQSTLMSLKDKSNNTIFTVSNAGAASVASIAATSSTFGTITTTGGVTVGGGLGVNGGTTIAGGLAANGGLSTTTLSSSGLATLHSISAGGAGLGNTQVTGTLGASGNFNVATDKFFVAAATGNTEIAGTLAAGATGLASLSLATALPLTSGGTGANSAAGARTGLGLGTMAIQDAGGVSITGGSISGVTISGSTVNGNVSGSATSVPASGVTGCCVAITAGGTGASDAATARSNLGANNASNLNSGTLNVLLFPLSGVTSGTYSSVTVDAYGRVTAGGSASPSGIGAGDSGVGTSDPNGAGGAITFTIDGATAGVWNPTGLGIGTSSPSQKLDVNGDAIIRGAAGTSRNLFFGTGTSKRWSVNANSTAEGGSNVGSDFVITKFADDGTTATNVFSITRSNNAAAFAGAVSSPSFSGAFYGNLVGNVTGNISGKISLPDGTSVEPGIFFTDDTDTGLYRPASDAMSVSAGGMDVARFVGVGTTAANYLTLNNSAAGSAVSVGAAGTDTDISVGITPKGAGTVRLGSNLANYLTATGAAASSTPVLGVTGSDTNINLQLMPKGTGGVGIGTSSANTAFKIQQDATYASAAITFHARNINTAGQTSFYLENDRGSWNSYGGYLYGGSTMNSGSTLFGVTRNDKLFMFADGANNLGMFVGTLANSPLVFGVNNVEAMRISGGNVGIGTSTPRARLDVQMGSAFASTTSSTVNSLGASSTGAMTVASTGGLTTGTSYAFAVDNEILIATVTDGTTLTVTARGAYGTTGVAHANGSTVSAMISAAGRTQGLVPAMVTTTLGYAGIGVASPLAPLHVYGGQQAAIFGSSTDGRYITVGDGSSNSGAFIQYQSGLARFGEHGYAAALNVDGTSVSIGTTSAPVATALLELASNNKGFLPPRMTSIERDLIAAPATGLVIYNVTTNLLNVFNGTGWVTAGNDGTNAVSFPQGSVSEPGLYVTGDRDTGLYQATEDTISVTAGATEVVRFNTAANAVNYFTVTPSATNTALRIAAAGSDTNVGIAIMPKGSGAITLGTATSNSAFFQVNMPLPTTSSYAALFNKTRSPTYANRYTFLDVGGLTGDADGGALWRGFHLVAPPITDPTGGAWVYPTLAMYSEYNSLSAPTTRNWIIDAGNDTTTSRHNLMFRTGGSNTRMTITSAGAIGVGTSIPAATALFELSSTTQGFLLPRMDNTARNAISSPANGLMIYNTTSGLVNVYNGTTWVAAGNDGVTALGFPVGTVGGPGLYVSGDTDTGFYQATPDTLSVTAGAKEVVRYSTTASAVNYFNMAPSATAGAITMTAAGTDTNVSIALMPKGTGGVGIGTNVASSMLTVLGTVTATAFSGNGALLTSLSAPNLTGALPAISGANLTSLTAANLTGALPAISGASLLTLNGSAITTGTVAAARLGSGTADSTTFLRGDNTWQTISLGSFAAGTVGAPGWAVQGDLDTGLFQAASSANSLSIAAGGSEAARFTTAGSAVNYFNFAGSATGNRVVMSPAGSDTNIGIQITPKGTGSLLINTAATTTSAFEVNATAITNGNAAQIASSSNTGVASGSSTTLRVVRSGANTNTAHTAYGIYSLVNNTNATSGTNIAGYFSAYGATTANYGLIVDGGNVGFGTATPSSKAILELASTTQGFLPPRMDSTERDAITSPGAGNIVYNTTTNKLNIHNGTAWGAVGATALAALTDDVTINTPANSQILQYNGSKWVNTALTSAVAGTAGPSFSVNRNGIAQTVAAQTWVKISWTTEVFDTNNNFASDRFTPTVAGKYQININAYCGDAIGLCWASIYKNGAQYATSVQNVNGNGMANVSTIIDMNGTTDYVEAYQWNGGSSLRGDSFLTFFTGAMLAPLASGTVAGTGSSGHVPVWTSGNAITYDNNVFNYDIVNHNLGIGTSTPSTKAILELQSTTKGFLPPRMTTTNRDAITSPGAGNMIYNTTTGLMNVYNGTAWVGVGAGQTTFDAGTFSAPGWAVTTDLDTGLFQAASSPDTLSVAAGGRPVARFVGVASAVNYVTLTPSATGNNVSVGADGTDTNISVNITPKGTGTVNVPVIRFASVSGSIGVNGAGGTAAGISGNVQYNNGNAFAGAVGLNYATSGTNVLITSLNASDVPLAVRAATSQSGNLQEWRNSAGTPIAVVMADGSHGIGTSAPSAALHVVGDIKYTGVITDVSDRRLKDNIKALEDSALTKIMALKPVSYTMKQKPDGTEFGFIAQELEEVLPNLVKTEKTAEAYKSVNYVGLISPLVKAIQELKALFDGLVAKVETLVAQVTGHDAAIKKLEADNRALRNDLEEIKALIKGMKSGAVTNPVKAN